MKITMINGSPKPGENNSGTLIKYLTSLINENETDVYNISKLKLSDMQFEEMKKSSALVFAFPLYVDGIPSHLLRFLMRLERMDVFDKNTMVYCIVNNGFFEGKQNHIAVSQMKNWCIAAGLTWGQAVGIGAGEMLPFLKNIPFGYGPNKNTGKAINEIANNIKTLKSGDDLFVSPNWPRFLWKMQGTRIWNMRAKKNGLRETDLYN